MTELTTAPTPAALAPSDGELIQCYARGDRAALEELFRRHRAVAYRVAYRLLGHEADALDAVQDGLVKAFTNLRHFQNRSSFLTWLLRIVSNAALDLGRGRQRRDLPRVEAGWADPEPAAPPAGAGDALAGADLRRQFDAALAALPEAQRRTFVLHVDGELSYREIADALGISIGTVMSRLFYARQRMRALLSNWLEP